MMPVIPTSLITVPGSKPKIGFSIDSIVGNGLSKHDFSNSSHESLDRPLSPYSDYSNDPNIHNISNHLSTSPVHRSSTVSINLSNDLRNRIRRSSRSPPVLEDQSSIVTIPPQRESTVPIKDAQTYLRNMSPRERCISPDDTRTSRSPSPSSPKGPILVPGIPAGLGRPFSIGQNNIGDMKTMPSYISSQEMVAAHPNPHFLAAQFQMAAAIAHGQTGGPPIQVPGGAFPQHQSHFANPNFVRDSYPLYPWLLSRHGRLFPHRFPGNFLLQPFRKPKRVRTAFSPTQLLKLEHAFENNHYVVGAERKTLAQALNLTETQVKVWFQNRRTKHKRMQQEEDGKDGSNGRKITSSPGNNNNNESQNSFDEDELIDMDDCSSDEENIVH